MADDDRITGLPESVLVLILSFLPVHDAIKTEILSKRWQFLWTYLPSLRFSQDHATNEGFVAFVDKTLPLFNCSKLEKFGVDFDYQSRFAPNVNSWVRFAAGKGVEELCLDFYSVAAGFVSHELPQVLYTNASFRSLDFSLCRVTPKGNVAWNSLKKLSIGYVKLSNGVMEKILAGSPVLEVLELLEISAPYLQSLEISCCIPRNCQLRDISSLVDATLDCDGSDDNNERIQDTLRGLVESLVHVKRLSLGAQATKVGA
ncbi:hypothetical protein C3L33_06296, partial [Rhododendron williamsianum]